MPLPTFCIQGFQEYLILWEGYRREEASWVREDDITKAAITSVCRSGSVISFYYTDENENPNPPQCILHDGVSNKQLFKQVLEQELFVTVHFLFLYALILVSYAKAAQLVKKG